MAHNNFDIKIESRTIDNLRVILCFLILIIHMPLLVKEHEVNIYNNIIYFIYVLFKRGICSVAVPSFFFISGFLFFYNIDIFQSGNYIYKIKKRLKTLLVPYVIWNILYIIHSYITNPATALTRFNNMGGGKMLWNCNRFGEDCSNTYNILGYCLHNSAPIDGPLWFIRDLMIICILSPIIYIFVKKFKQYGLCILGLMMILNIWIPIEGFSSTCFFFFSFGAYFSLYKISFVSSFRKYMLPGIILSIISLVAIVTLYGNSWLIYNIVFNTFNIIGCVTTIALISYLPKIDNKIWGTIKNSSFFIFAAHFAIVQLIATYLFKYLPETYSIIIYFATPIIVLIIIEFIFILLKRIPVIIYLLNGGR